MAIRMFNKEKLEREAEAKFRKELEAQERKKIIEKLRRENITLKQGLSQSTKQFKQAVENVDPYSEVEALRQIFGHGQKIWSLENSGTRVNINRTLFRGNTETSNLFGWGNDYYPKLNSTARLFF